MQNQTVQPVESDLDGVKQYSNGQQNGRMRQELLQQFQGQGVTQPLPANFNEAISPRRRLNGSSPLLRALAEQIEK